LQKYTLAMAAFGGHHLVLAARTYVYNTYISEFFLKKN
jgi:hypothetical protein